MSIDKIKAELLSRIDVEAAGRVLAAGELSTQVRLAAESMKLFERNGMIQYGKWQEWWRAPADQQAKLLAEFRATGS